MKQSRRRRLIERSWRKTLLALREDCPVPNVVVRRVRRLPDGIFGDSAWDGRRRRFVIRVAWEYRSRITRRWRASTPEEMNDTLVHEWAHCMSWNTWQGDHESAWGAAYAHAYEATEPA